MNNTRTLTEFNITWTQHARLSFFVLTVFTTFFPYVAAIFTYSERSTTRSFEPLWSISYLWYNSFLHLGHSMSWSYVVESSERICNLQKDQVHNPWISKNGKAKHTDIACLWCTKWENHNIAIMCSVFMLPLNFCAPSKYQPNSLSKPWRSDIVKKELTGRSTVNWPMCLPFPIVTFEQANIAEFSCIISVRQQDQPNFDMFQQPNQLPVTAKKLNLIVTKTKFDRLKGIK